MILFMRDRSGLIEMINKTSISLEFRKTLQFLGSAHQRMEDAQVGDRELQATPERKDTVAVAKTSDS